jgi:predicted 3-demethylubiquinone-9 3-methyltransferase (glyoxalase superfamily)
MNTPRIVPCLWFDDQAEAASDFYVAVFPDGRLGPTAHYPTSGTNPSGKPPGSVMTVDFTIAGRPFTALNGGADFTINPSISFFVYLPTDQEVDELYHALQDGGQALMPLDAYAWSTRYAWVMDRFGVSWQVMRSPGVESPTIAPSLMFTGPQHGRAREAIDAYLGTFPRSSVERLEPYLAGEGPEGTIKYASFTLAGQPLAAMDSDYDHGFTFTEGVSLQVMCADQEEIDHYWRGLSAGGEAGPCGWLEDRFGVSWQVVPEALTEWMTHPDAEARERAFDAMLGMGKIDIAALRRALAAP